MNIFAMIFVIIISLFFLVIPIFALYMMMQPITCRHGTLAHADCRICEREMDEWYEEEMKLVDQQHGKVE